MSHPPPPRPLLLSLVALLLVPATSGCHTPAAGGAPAGRPVTATPVPRDLLLLDHHCNDGSAVACYELASILVERADEPGDFLTAEVRFELACDGGIEPACAAVGLMKLTPVRGEPDPEGARALFEQSCSRGSMAGCANLAYPLLMGWGGEPDVERAARLFEDACVAGGADSCTMIGRMIERGIGREQDEPLAREVFDHACQQGSDGGCLRLADMWVDGRGGRADEDAAEELFYAGCSMLLGSLGEFEGVRRELAPCDELFEHWQFAAADPDEPLEAAARACENGLGEGCFLAGWLWTHEPELLHAPGMPGLHFDRACAHGYLPACPHQGGGR